MSGARGRIGIVVLGTLLLMGLCMPAAFAAPKLPSIDDVVGSYTLQIYKYYILHTQDGSAEGGQYAATLILEKIGPATLRGTVVEWDNWQFTAYYVNGMVVMAMGEPNGDLPDYTYVMYATCSGKPGRVKMTGEWWFLDWEGDGYRCYRDSFKGRMDQMNFTSQGAQGGGKGNKEKEVAPDASATPNVPPEIGDLAGTYDVKIKSALYEPTLGARGRESLRDTWEISVADTDALTIVTGLGAYTAYYDNGILVIGYADSSVLSEDAGIVYLTAAFKGGRIILSGYHVGVADLGTSDDEVESARIQAFQRRDQ